MPDALKNDDELSNVLCPHDGTFWMYFTSRPRQEKKLYQALLSQAIPCYLPQVKKTTEYAHRVYSRMVPMFSGYVFASTCPQGFDIVKLNSSLLKVHFLSEAAAAELLHDLKTVRKYEILAKEHKVAVYPPMTPGTAIQVTKGYFKGEYAVVQKMINHETVSIYLSSLQMTLSVELPVDFVERNCQIVNARSRKNKNRS